MRVLARHGPDLSDEPVFEQWRQRGSNPRCETASLASSQLDDVPVCFLTK